MSEPGGRYTTTYLDRQIEVEATGKGLTSTTTLYVDGEQVAQESASFDPMTVTHEEISVKVECWWPGRISKCVLLVPADEPDAKPHEVPLDPPPGTRAAKLAALKAERPGLYASRHVALAIGEILVAVLGIGILVRGLLPNIDLSWLTDKLPDVDLPDGPDLSWIPDPLGWLWGLLPDISLSMPDWLDPILATTKYWIPILIAVLVAANEVEKRRKAQQAKARQDEDGAQRSED